MATVERPPEPEDLADGDEVAGHEPPAASPAPAQIPDLQTPAGSINPAQLWPGALLTPEAIATYEELVPGAAERILKLAEHNARSDTQLWSDDEGTGAGLSIFVALVFFGLAVGGVHTSAALIAGGCFMAVGLVILLCGWFRWATLRKRPRGGPR